jgi:hypothetical protein
MALTKIQFQPGINKEGTQYSAASGWFDSDKIRFRKGRVESIGGWAKYSNNTFQGVCRSLKDWAIITGDLYLGVGTNLRFYVERDTLFYDVTPIRLTTAAGDPRFTAVDGDSILTVEDTDHGATPDDWVIFEGATGLGGNITAEVLNQQYQIINVEDDDTYTIEAKDTSGNVVTANSSDTGNGGAGTIAYYLLETGTNYYVDGAGWGVGPWGSGGWGTRGEITFGEQLRLYSQDIFGPDLIFCARGGPVAYWSSSSPRLVTAAGDVTFDATIGSSTITVNETAHGCTESPINPAGENQVTFSGATALSGSSTITADVLNQTYTVDSIIDADTYTITAKNTEGTPVNSDVAVSADTAGGAVVASYAGGVYQRAKYLTDAVAFPSTSNAPSAAFQVMVSDIDRHVICFGVNPLGSDEIDPLLVRWSDQENATDWTPTAINSAGGQVLSTGTTIVGATKTRQEILIFTDEGIQSMRYIGAPFVYSFNPVAENISLISPNAAVTAADAVFFMDREGFYVYRGSVQRLPCSVLDYVFTNVQMSQRYKIFAVSNPDDSEVTWFYPVGTASADVTNYVTYNYLENSWAIGTMDRGTYGHTPTKDYPVASSNNLDDVYTQYLYSQEFGYDADGSALNAYVESGGVGLQDGESFMTVRRFIPDFTFRGTSDNADITVTLKGRDFPLGSESTLSTSTVTSTTNQNHVRARTRELIVRIEANNTGYGWTLGDMRFDTRTDGKR